MVEAVFSMDKDGNRVRRLHSTASKTRTGKRGAATSVASVARVSEAQGAGDNASVCRKRFTSEPLVHTNSKRQQIHLSSKPGPKSAAPLAGTYAPAMPDQPHQECRPAKPESLRPKSPNPLSRCRPSLNSSEPASKEQMKKMHMTLGGRVKKSIAAPKRRYDLFAYRARLLWRLTAVNQELADLGGIQGSNAEEDLI